LGPPEYEVEMLTVQKQRSVMFDIIVIIIIIIIIIITEINDCGDFFIVEKNIVNTKKA
jgi:hypothetical protein